MVQTIANEKRYNIRENAYKIMKLDSTLVTSTAKENFIQQTETENMGLLVAVNDSLATGALASAESINSTVVDTNIIESNKLAVNNIIIAGTASRVLTLTANDTATLLSIAYQDAATGGEAVYRARAILRLRITDHSNISNLRLLQLPVPVKEINDIDVFPIPSTGIIFINANNVTFIQIEIYDITGRVLRQVLLKTEINFYKLDLSDVTAGSYTLRVTDSNNKDFVKKVILTK